MSTDVNFDALGQYELGASGIAAAILRGAALASQRLHALSSASKAAGGDECSAVSTLATITHKDFDDAARAQVGRNDVTMSRSMADASHLRDCSLVERYFFVFTHVCAHNVLQLLVTENECSRFVNSAYT